MLHLERYFHPLSSSHDLRHSKLNNPFEYRPSPVILEAQSLLMHHIERVASEDQEVSEELARGKMFGVMVVSNSAGKMGYIAAFSGCMAGRVEFDSFVPPIFGRGDDNLEFQQEDREIGAMSRKIEELKSSSEYIESQERYERLQVSVFEQIAAANEEYKVSKNRRDKLRQNSNDQSLIEQLQRESQHQKGEIKRLEHHLKGELKDAKVEALKWRKILSDLQDKRREMSNSLQSKMFKSYRVVNGRGEWQSLFQIFDDLLKRLPPSGAGECAAPKLMHYALTNELRPIALGEFWYGPSPRGEVRHHGHFYGACRSRCYPILTFMLQGLDVAEVDKDLIRKAEEPLQTIYEDDHLVVINKPAGMLSVPGRSSAPSVKSIIEQRYPNATGALMVHRLDQDTSGVLIVAKNAEVHKSLQRQFSERKLSKRYIAVIEGVIKPERGEINLPIRPNIDDRPRQMVDHTYGKPSLTSYEVIERGANFTRLALYPHTGRTHQLRLHCAHIDGLNTPIKGDRLYGREADDSTTRLHLHAEQITFTHPVSGESVTLSVAAPF
ncbi:MAG: pseudouridine synthase [Rikenellaceae bacterium]